MNLVERVKAILLQPKSEWPVIERESGDAGYLFTNYVCIVSAIPAVCSFIGTVIAGLGIVGGLMYAVVTYVLGLVGVFVMAYVIDFLAGTFNGQKNLDNAMKVSARNVGTVHESALPRTVLRRNSRRVWSVISFFIIFFYW